MSITPLPNDPDVAAIAHELARQNSGGAPHQRSSRAWRAINRAVERCQRKPEFAAVAALGRMALGLQEMDASPWWHTSEVKGS